MLAALMTGGHFCAACGDIIIGLNPSQSRTDHVEVSNTRQHLLAQRTPAIVLKMPSERANLANSCGLLSKL
jgi:hypothetical protein